MLDTGALLESRFGTATFENTSQGKLNLSFPFSFSKYYVDSLSKNVKRGQRTKAAQSWAPGGARRGYKIDPKTKEIVRDSDRFIHVQRMWQLMLTGHVHAASNPPHRDH